MSADKKLQKLFQKAISYHQKGNLFEADKAYAKVLEFDPVFVEALHMRGVLLSQRGANQPAIASLQSASRLQPGNPAIHHNLGKVFQRCGQFEQATKSFSKAIKANSKFLESYLSLGSVCEAMNQPEQASQTYQRALAINPNDTRILNNYANLLGRVGQIEQAIELIQKAIQLQPDNPQLHNNLGNIYNATTEHKKAEESYRQAIKINPGHAEFYFNLGNSLVEQDRHQESLAVFEKSIELNPNSLNPYNNYGNALQALGEYDLAFAAYEKATQIAPNDAKSHFNLAMALLRKGEYKKGWGEYEWGLKDNIRQPVRQFVQPRWQGERFDGKTLLVYSEQGYGDTFQFMRFLPWVKELGGHVLFETQIGISDMMSSHNGVDQAIERTQTGVINQHFDLYAPLMSMPHLLGKGLDGSGVEFPYIQVDESKNAFWQEKLNAEKRFKVGTVWAGAAGHSNDRNRSCLLSDFSSLFDLDKVKFYSLQKEGPGKQIAEFDGIVEDLAPELNRFTDTAAVINQLDLVISVDTSICHLAGALAKPVWILLPFVAEWRWKNDTNETSWYPTATLFRQSVAGDWKSMFEKVKTELEAKI